MSEDLAKILQITEEDLKALPKPQALMIKAWLNIKQALYDILGAYPQANVLPYWYQSSNTRAKSNAINGGSTGTNQIKISADAAFVACSVRGASTGDFAVQVLQDASDRQLTNEQVHSSAILGTAQFPGILHKPLLLPANTTITQNYADLSGQTNEIYFDYVGYKVYNRKVG
jgi:hypothetical protein